MEVEPPWFNLTCLIPTRTVQVAQHVGRTTGSVNRGASRAGTYRFEANALNSGSLALPLGPLLERFQNLKLI